LTESWDRDDDYDDDEDRDVKIANSDKRQQSFEKKNKPALDAAKKEMADKAKAQNAAAAKKKEAPAEKKEAPAAAAGAAAEAKRRGAKPNENSKAQRAVAWIKANPEAKRGAFLTWAKENLDMGSAYGSAYFAKHRVRGDASIKNECYMLAHPAMPSFFLAENRELNQLQWVDPTSPVEPMIYKTLAEAEKIATYMSEWKSQHADIVKVDLTDDGEE
jgi:hypothetical protein